MYWLSAGESYDVIPTFPAFSQINRRGRAVAPYLEDLRRIWLDMGHVTKEQHLILATIPVPVMGAVRSKTHSDFVGRARYGLCASRQLTYFGYKLVLLTTVDGVPVAFDLVPTYTDEREAAIVVLQDVQGYACGRIKAFWEPTGLRRLYSRQGIWCGRPNGGTRHHILCHLIGFWDECANPLKGSL